MMIDDTEEVSRKPDPLPEPAHETTTRSCWPMGLRLFAVFGLVILLAVPWLIWREELAQMFVSRELIADRVRRAGAWGPFLIIALGVAQTIVAPIPGQVVNIVAGYVYGWAAGLWYSWLGLVVGSAMTMGLARYAGRPLVKRLVPRTMLDRVDRAVARGGWRFLVLAFLIPGLPDDVICFVAGLTRLPLRLLIALSATARIPGLFAAVWFGAQAERVPWQFWALGAVLVGVGLWVAWRTGFSLQYTILRYLAGGKDDGGDL